MTPTHADHVTGEVRKLLAEHALAGWPDRDLLERFVRCRDGDAFAALLARHGPMVLRVCRAVLRDAHDAEDAFQATFLVLACGAAKVRNVRSVGGFLHGTAYRVAARARARAARRREAEKEAAQMQAEATAGGQGRHGMEAALHEELGRIPEKYRRAFVLCHLEGKTHVQAADALGCPVGSVSRHLRRACDLLRERLAARGLAVPAGLLVGALATRARAAVPAALARATLQAVGKYVAGAALVGGSSVPAVTLAKEALRTLTAFKLKGPAVVLVLVGLVAGGAALFARNNPAAGAREVAPPPAAGRQTAADDAPQTPVDLHGDPLPPGAEARLGTVRLRHGAEILALAFSPDGKALVSTGRDRALRLWEAPTGLQLARVPKQQDYIGAAAFSADGKTLAAVGEDGSIVLYEYHPALPEDKKPAEIGKERLRFKPDAGRVWFLAFQPDGNLVSGAVEGPIYVWDEKTGKEVRHFGNAAENKLHQFGLSPDGKTLAAGSGDADAVLWEVGTGESLGALPGHTKVSSFAFAPDGRTLAVGDETNTIRLWDLKTRKVTSRLIGKKAPHQAAGMGDAVVAQAFTADGKTLVSAGDFGDGTVRVWNVETGEERCQLHGRNGDGNHLALSPDGKTLALAGRNSTVGLWDLTTGKELATELGSQGAVGAVAVAPDGKQVAVAASGGVIRLWDRATGREVRSFRAHTGHVTAQIDALAFSPDGTRLASSKSGDSARLWDVTTGKEVRAFDGAQGDTVGVSRACYSPDGRKLALATYAPGIQLVDPSSGEVERTIAVEKDVEKGSGVNCLSFAPDGNLLAGGFHTMHVWDAATGKEKWAAENIGTLTSVAFTPDGLQVVTGSWHEIVLWNAATGQVVYRQARDQARSGAVRAVAISPDGRLLAVSGDEERVVLYELATGQRIHEWTGHAGFVWSLAFAPDGRSLVSGSWDATALVWDLTGRELAKKQREPLTDAELEARWTALNGEKADEAHQAILSLANTPKQATTLLRAHLVGGTAPDAQNIAKWLADLDDDEFAVREKASRALAELGKGVEADLQRARGATRSAEVGRRLDELLDRLGGGKRTDEKVRMQRGVAVLELAATAATKELLEQLATKAASEELRRQARGALDRLAKRS
jgi:RNA polymerase sigma factor (sigma-70 family)